MSTRIFFWATGQDDNVGDVLLRRRMIRGLAPHGRLFVYVADATPGFIESLLVDVPEAVVYSSFRRWVVDATRHSLSSRWLLAYNPGELKVSAWYAQRYAALLPAQILARFRGNSVIRMGVGIRAAEEAKQPWLGALRLSARLSSVNTWRNVPSRDAAGIGSVQPDWGFDENFEGQYLPIERTRLAVTMRFDKPAPSDQWCAAVDRLARELGLRPVIVSQVRRDSPTGDELARRTGWDVEPWGADVSHLDQERRLRAVYREAAGVISDRLHALVVGLTEGAIPVAVFEHSESKVALHFQAAQIPLPVSFVKGVGEASIVRALRDALDAGPAVLDAANRTRARVREADNIIAQQLPLR